MKELCRIGQYLVDNPSHFCKENSVDTIEEIIKFKMKKAQNIAHVGDYFLCDIYANEMWIVELLSKPVYNSIRKQKLIIKPIKLIVDDCGDKFPTFNGYWTIPNLDEQHSKDGGK